MDSHNSSTITAAALAQSLRVLIVEPQSSGGMWHYALSVCKALASAGAMPALATTFPFEQLETSGIVQISALGTLKPHIRRRRTASLSRIIEHIAKLRRIHALVSEFRPQILHLHNPLGKFDFLYLKFLKAQGIGIVYTAHDAVPLDRDWNWFDWARYRVVDAILVHSSRDAETLVAHGINSSLITIIPHGNYLHLCPEVAMMAEKARSTLNIPADSRTVLFLGTIAPYKGLDLLIDAFAKLSDTHPNVFLLVAGEPLEDFAPYRRLIERNGIGERVILRLERIPFEEFPMYFSAADVVVFPYRRISQSGALQLAYAYGRPVVVTNVGGLGEAVGADGSGLVAPTLDGDGLRAAIDQILSDPIAAADMGTHGRRMAETKYSWNTIAQRILEVYQSIGHDGRYKL